MSPLGFIGITKLPPSAHDDKNLSRKLAIVDIELQLKQSEETHLNMPWGCSTSALFTALTAIFTCDMWPCYVHCSVREGQIVLH